MSRRKQKEKKDSSQPSNQESPLLKIAIAIIGAMALIIVALINRSTATLPAEFTQTAEARHTSNAITSQVSTTVLIKTSTPDTIPSQAATSTWTPNTHSVTPTSTVIFEDTFIDNHNNWHIDTSSSYIAAGKYVIDVSCPDEHDSFYCGTSIKIPFTFPKDFHIEMDITILNSSPNANVAIGFQLRRKSTDYYYINYFITDSFYSLRLTYDKRYLEIVPKTSTDLISKELNSTNRFGIIVQGTKFTPTINGMLLPQGEDGNLTNAGDTHIAFFISYGNSARLQIDNLVVQETR